MGDLFDQPLAEFPPSHSRIPAAAPPGPADHELLVAVLILDDVVAGRRIGENQFTLWRRRRRLSGGSETMATRANVIAQRLDGAWGSPKPVPSSGALVAPGGTAVRIPQDLRPF
jgi:hypothetical protein